MRADYLSYKRAAGVSLLGLSLQLVMGLAMLLYSVLARPQDQAALTASMFILLGAPVWLLLAIVFDQHRREQIEAMEAEALGASGARDASVFAGKDDEFRVAGRRLAWMHRILVPTFSLVYAGALAAVGVWRFLDGRQYLQPDTFVSPPKFGWAISIGLGLALVGFVFARYVSGMAKQPVWANLRAGAACAVGAALFGAALAIAQFVDYIGPNDAIRYLHVIFPAAMVLLAVEVLLNFLLGLYRPRVQGEIPRPAFDSRVLGFVAAPDRIAESIGGAINYQFGFDVTSSWFYQLLTRSALALVLVGLAVVWLLTCVAIVEPNQQGLRVRLGHRVGDTLMPGPYLKLPWPLERIDRIDATVVRRINLGGEQPKLKNKSILWTNDHGVEETFFAVRPAAEDVEATAQPGAGGQSGSGGKSSIDFALVSAEVPLLYSITDFAKFLELGAMDQVEERLRAIGRHETFTYLATQNVDQVLGDARGTISRTLRDRIEKRFAELGGGQGAGVKVLFVGIEGVHPPRETAASFEAIVQARQKQKGSVQVALDEANRSVIVVAGSVETARRIVQAIDRLETMRNTITGQPTEQQKKSIAEIEQQIQDLLVKAGGSASSSIQESRADRWVRHMEQRARAQAFVGQIAGYRVAPLVYAAQQYFDALRESLAPARVYIVADDGKLEMRTILDDVNTGGNLFLNPQSKETP